MTAPTGVDLSEDQLLAVSRCASCPKMCRSACPTLEVTRNERHQPWGHARDALAAARGDAGAAAAASSYACATCAACTVPCEVEGVETPELAWAVRAAVWDAGEAPAVIRRAAAEAAAGRVLVADSPPEWGEPRALLAELAELADPRAPLLLVPGCGVLGRRPRAALAAGRALVALGVPFRVAARHRCCGAIALAAGDSAGVEAGLAAAAEVPAGVERIAVQSPSCAHLLGVRAPATGRPLPVEVEPLAATLARALASRRGGGEPASQAVAYHDPCFLARHQERAEEPRRALAASGHEVIELDRRGPTTRCSGRGGLLALSHPDIAAGYLALLRDELRARGSASVVTGCGSCAAALDTGREGVEVRELAEAVCAALVGGGEGRRDRR